MALVFRTRNFVAARLPRPALGLDQDSGQGNADRGLDDGRKRNSYRGSGAGWYRQGGTAATLDAGFHILFPFIDRIRYKHSLKEAAIDIPEQVCITRDNVQVSVDGILYLKVLNPQRASYGISDFHFALIQLGQTTLRSEIGKIELDRTFEDRININIQAINQAEGEKQQVIKASEAKKQQQINEAEGAASAILAIAQATAEGLRKVAETIQIPGGQEAVQLRVAEQYITKFGELAKATNTLILPATVSDVGSMIALAMNAIRQTGPITTIKS